MKVQIDPRNVDLRIVRQIILKRLREDEHWKQLSTVRGSDFDPWVDYTAHVRGDELVMPVYDVCWQLIIEGILAPGLNPANPGLPWFHVTEYGEKVLTSIESPPNDPTGYLDRVRSRVASPDPTVIAYMGESVQTFLRGNLVASMVMLGISAERVFDLLCASLLAALAIPTEHRQFQKVLDRFPMKPKLDWVYNKLNQIQARRPTGFPDNSTIAVTTIYDFIRMERNDLGHPRPVPPRVEREDAFGSLELFPRYYQITEQIRKFLAATKV